MKPLRASRTVERLEEVGGRKAQGVRRSVGGRDKRRSSLGEQANVRGDDTRHIGVDDDDRAFDAGKGSRDGRALPFARVGDDLDPRGLLRRGAPVGSHHTNRADGPARGKDILEHGGRERAAHLG